jgi:hypothetical protein
MHGRYVLPKIKAFEINNREVVKATQWTELKTFNSFEILYVLSRLKRFRSNKIEMLRGIQNNPCEIREI